MNQTLLHDVGRMIAEGLKRKAATSASKWAEKYRIMGGDEPGPWSFKYRPWLRGMHDSKAEKNIGQKSAQMGFTETLLNLTFWAVDIKRWDVLYVLPSQRPDAYDFSSGRFNPAIELCPYLERLFSDVQNVGHKRSGAVNIYIRGSKSIAGLKGLPVGFIGLDEVEEFPKEHVPLALERAAGRQEYMAWLISTPSLAGKGINKYYVMSTREIFTFPCPACSKWTDLSFPECLHITADDPMDPGIENSHLLCKECKTKLHHQNKWEWLADGQWHATNSQSRERGFHVNRLYSSAALARPAEIAKAYLLSKTDPTEATIFWNSKMGLTYEAEGARISETDIATKIEGYPNGGLRPDGLITMGVDVGPRELHYEISQWTLHPFPGMDVNSKAHCKVLLIGKAPEWSDLDRLMMDWGVHSCVVDSQPESRNALQFVHRFYGRVNLCLFGHTVSGRDVQQSEKEWTVKVNRTSWMDMAFSRFKREEMIMLPSNTPFEYKAHLQIPVRVYRKDRDGNNIGYYESDDKPDHYALAHTYNEIALKTFNWTPENTTIASPR